MISFHLWESILGGFHMDSLAFTLRQRKILYLIQNSSDFITSGEVATALNVSSRTVRNDINVMNDIMAPYNARIISTNSKGFIFEADDPQLIRQISQIDVAFFTREERVRYLAFRLCESKNPLDLYDLEEEIFISHSALISDIQSLKKKYSYGEPNIRINIHGDSISLEQNEFKIRLLLLNLFHHDWDYDSDINAYYNHDFLDGDLLNIIMTKTPAILINHGLQLDDPTLKALELSLAIMHKRYCDNHILPDVLPPYNPKSNTGFIVQELFEIIENHTDICYVESEKNRIAQFISNVSLAPQKWSIADDSNQLISPFTIKETHKYLDFINEFYYVDFSKDKEFVGILQIFLQQLLSGHTTFQQFQSSYSPKETLTAEYELAWLFQYLSVDYMNRYLQESELSSLAVCFSGAIRHYLQEHPNRKLKAVLFSHRNMTSAWALKRHILESFQLYLDIIDILPLNYIDNYDFSGLDIVFTTIHKPISNKYRIKQIIINDSLDVETVADVKNIKLLSFNNIWPKTSSINYLLINAFFHENVDIKDELRLIEIMMQDFITDGIATEEHLLDITKREAISSFGIKPGLFFVYSVLPARKTKLSIMTLKHRMRWNGYRVSTIVMGTFSKEDSTLLFHLKLLLCNRDYDCELLRQLKSKNQIIEYLLKQ